MHNKIVTIRNIHADPVRELRNKLVKKLTVDIDDLEFKLRDALRVMESHNEHAASLTTFEKFHGSLEYEGDLVKMTAEFLMETSEIVVL